MKKRNICVSAAAVMTAVMLYGCAGSSVPAETVASANVAASAENGKESVENEQKTETAGAGKATAAVTLEQQRLWLSSRTKLFRSTRNRQAAMCVPRWQAAV